MEQVEDLEAAFPQYNIIRAPISITSRERAFHAIFYNPQKFSLVSNGSFSEINRARRNANWTKLIEIKTGTMLFVINGHFLVPAEPQVRLDAAIQYATQIALLNTENAPIIMLGDLNDNLSSQPVQYLTSEVNAFPDLEYAAGFRQLFTPSQWKRNSSFGDQDVPITDSIDFILTSEDLRFSGAEKVSRAGFLNNEFYYHSDHAAVLERVCFGSPAHLLVPLYFQLLLDEQQVNTEMENDTVLE